jgi:single-strand DNA-binding protein
MNKVMFVGNIVNDCDLAFVGEGEGTAKARFTIACNERLGKDKEKVNYIPCVLWGKMAEGLADYLVKGVKVAISGRLDIDNVQQDDDSWKTYVNVNVNELDFCSSSKKEEEQSKNNKQSRSNKTEKTRRNK